MKLVFILIAAAAQYQTIQGAEPIPLRQPDVSFRHEVQRAIERGNDFLKASQNTNGWWSTPDHPSVTALALSAMMGEPKSRFKNSPEVKKGYAFVVSCAQADGGIYVTNL